MTNEEIYKFYKKGGNFKDIALKPRKIYLALKENGLQVSIFKGLRGKEIVYIYTEETETFNKII